MYFYQFIRDFTHSLLMYFYQFIRDCLPVQLDDLRWLSEAARGNKRKLTSLERYEKEVSQCAHFTHCISVYVCITLQWARMQTEIL